MITANEIINSYDEERSNAQAVLEKTQNDIEEKLTALLSEINQIEDEDARDELLDAFNDQVRDFACESGLDVEIGNAVEFWLSSTC